MLCIYFGNVDQQNNFKMNLDDEDYWNTSSTTGFSFEDDEVATASSLFESAKLSSNIKQNHGNSTIGNFSNFAEPIPGSKCIEALVSKRSLSLILGEKYPAKAKGLDLKEEVFLLRKQVSEQWLTPPPASIIKAIVLGRPFSLHLFKSYKSKSDLLEAALKSRDGNAILCVVLFLSKTLKKPLFSRLLQLQPAALPVYINFLSTRLEFNAVRDILMALGQFRNAAFKDFQFLINPNQTVEKRAQNLKNLKRDHFSSLEAEDKVFLDNFLQFVDWQATSDLRNSPTNTVSKALSHLCLNNWYDSRETHHSPFYLRSVLNANERLFHYRAISALSSVQKWEDLAALIITKGWLASKKLKSVIPAEKIVVELHNSKAPETVMKEYFCLVDSLEKQLSCALKLKWHTAVIDTYVAMKDRQALLQYKASLSTQEDVYIYAESSLRLSIKWIN